MALRRATYANSLCCAGLANASVLQAASPPNARLGAPRLRAPDAWNHAKIKSRKRSVLAAGIEIDGPSLDARPFASAAAFAVAARHGLSLIHI